MSFWKRLFKRDQSNHKDDVENPTVSTKQLHTLSDNDNEGNAVLNRMENELNKAVSNDSIDGVILDAYPGHEMSCPVHGTGGINIFTGEKKHQFRLTGDRIVCTACGKTAINPSKGGRPWIHVANDINLKLIIAHRQAILKAMSK